MSEATPGFEQRLQEAFDEMHVGQTFTFRRTSRTETWLCFAA